MHSCPECQTTLEPWEGQPAPRLYGFTAKHVAWALTQVAGGASYRSTAADVRERAGRQLEASPGKTASGRPLAAPTQHGQLVSDWVDVFAPVIWSAYAPTRWPYEALLDDDTLKYSVPGAPTGVTAFYVLAVMGYTPQQRPYVAAIEAFPRATKATWGRFLATLPGQPRWAVTDGGVTARAARTQWPDAELWRCEWHLRKNLLDKLPGGVRDMPSDPLNGFLNRAQLTPRHWDEYLAALEDRQAAEGGLKGARTAAYRLDHLIREQSSGRPDDLPLSTGPLEEFFRGMDSAIGDRAAKMTNKRRADALLKLIAARRNGWANENRWTDIIRQHLAARRGLAAHQRQHTDPRTKPSLR